MSERLPRTAVDKLLALGAEEPEAAGGTPGGLANLDRYRLIREVGRGGMGRVYEAEDTQLRRRVALKLMPETVGLSEVMRRRFAREAQAVAKLTHPHIAAIYDATPDYIAMQFVEGCTILEFPRDDPKISAALIRDAALAVQYAHECGVIHRDLKPSNLMVEEGGTTTATAGEGGHARGARVFVLDFGLAKETAIESSLSTSGSIVGTPSYMPPEQAEGRGRDVDVRSDVYALGATLYACLTGLPPFPEDEMLSVLRRVVEEDAKSPRIESDLDAIVLKCLAKEPERRYQTARELAEDLTRWLRGEAVVAKPPSLGYRFRKFVSRRKALLRASAIGAVATLGIAAAIFVPIELQRRAVNRALDVSMQIDGVIESAGLLMRGGKRDEAYLRLDQAIDQCMTFLADYDVAHVHYLHGRLLRLREDRDAAEAALIRAIERDPEHAGARLERALLLLAERARQVALQRVTTDEPTEEERAELAKLRRDADADLEIVEGGEQELRMADLLYARAERDRQAERFEDARRGLEEVLSLDAEHGEAILAMSRTLFDLGETAEARKYQERLPSDASLGFARAFVARAEEGAPEVIVGSVKRIPGSDYLIADFAEEFNDDTDIRAAVARTSGRIALACDLARDGQAAQATGELVSTVEALSILLDEDPDMAGALLNRAVCRAELEKLLVAGGRTVDAVATHADAISDLDAVTELAGDFLPGYFNRALLRHYQADRLAALGRFGQANSEFEQAVTDLTQVILLDPQDAQAWVRRAQARAERANMMYATRQVGPAGDMRRMAASDFDRAVELAPEAFAVRYARGVFRAATRAEGAAEDLQLALQHAPEDWSNRRRCQRRLDQLQEDTPP